MNHSHNMADNYAVAAHKDWNKHVNKAHYMADMLQVEFRFCHKDKLLFARKKKAPRKLWDKKSVRQKIV